jgi:outer membrane biosynthesis protein TonB
VLGMDCARIIAHNGLPFSFPVESLAYHGLFEQGDVETYEPVEDDPPPPHVGEEEPVATAVWPETAPAPEPPVEPEPEPEPALAAIEPEPEAKPEPEPEPEPVVVAAVEPEPVVLDPMPAEATRQERLDILKLFSAIRAGRELFGGNQLLEISASVAAVATPVVFYLLLNFLRGKPPDDKH